MVPSNVFLYYLRSLTKKTRTWAEGDLEFCRGQENERVLGMSLDVWYLITLNGFQLNFISETVVCLGQH